MGRRNQTSGCIQLAAGLSSSSRSWPALELRAPARMEQAAFEDGHFSTSVRSRASSDCELAAMRSRARSRRFTLLQRVMSSFVANSSAERITQLAVNSFRPCHSGRSDLWMSGDVHFPHLFNRHVRIGVRERMPIKDKLPFKFGDCYWHGWAASSTVVVD